MKTANISLNVQAVQSRGMDKSASVKDKSFENYFSKNTANTSEKAQPVIEKGRALQSAFLDRLFVNTDEDMRHAFFETVGIMNRNLDSLLKGEFPL